MGRKSRQPKKQKSDCIPPVANGGIHKKNHSNQPPSFVIPNYPQPNPYQLPGFPILPFPVRLVTGPSLSSAPPSLPPFNLPPPSLVIPTLSSIPPTAPSVTILPSSTASKSTPVQKLSNKTPSKTQNRKDTAVLIVSTPKGALTDAAKKKTQLKYARQLAARANKKKSIALALVVKKEPKTTGFNMFMNIAERYRSAQKEPDAIEIEDVTEEDDVDVEEIEQEEGGRMEKGRGMESILAEDAGNDDVTIVEDMSICTVDEEGETTTGTLCTVDEVGEETMKEVVEGEEEEGEGEKEEEITLVENKGEEEEEDDDEILCLGEQKSDHVLSEIVILDDSDSEIEEINSEDSETSLMNKAFNGDESLPPMEKSIIDLSLDEGNGGRKKVASGAELPDFIPLIDKEKKKKGKGNQQQSPFVQPVRNEVQQKNGGSELKNGSCSAPSSPMVMMTRTKNAKDKKREAYRKKVETRTLPASPSSIARAVAASTCSFPPIPQPFFTPSNIPLPTGPIPPSPFSHLLRFPPGSLAPSALPPSSSAMGLIQSRGISTSAPQSQPVNFGGYGRPPPSIVSGMGGACSTTLASVLQDDAVGLVRDSLTASGAFVRRWETESPYRSDVNVDPSAAPFRICSYNVLCQKTISATEYLYRHAKFQPHVLQWAHRWPLIQKELRELNADVFGLQEIQDIHFEQYYEPFMKSLGYMCFFQPKSESFHSDGLGIFVKSNRFQITSTKTIDFLVPGDNLLNRGNVAQLLRVECLQTGAPLIITNTHILFNEKRGDIKLGQIALLMANIHAIRQEDEPVICLGDWNLEPQSDLYNYITNGSLDGNKFVSRYGSGQLREGRNFSVAPMRELPIDTHLKTKMSRDGVLHQNEGALLQSLQQSQPSMFSHQIPLASTYAPYRERQVSTYHKDMANPDFIFYTTAGRGEKESRRLRLIRRLAVPSEYTTKQKFEPWPNHYIPSDHIPLMAEFYLAK